MARRIWPYILWPVLILNIIPVCIFGAVFALGYRQGANPQGIDLTGPLFWLYAAILLINWGLAFSVFWLFKRQGESVRVLISPGGKLFQFNWRRALILFIVFNAIWVIYVAVYAWLAGGWPSYSGLQTWQKAVFIALFPISAGFTEELFWRGFIITRVEQAGGSSKRAILLSAIGFALVHGIFFPDKVAATFLLGLVAGWYYARERTLVPLMAVHAFMDLWSYGISLFAS